MPTYEDVLDNITLKASEIISRDDTNDIVCDLYDVICVKCENGELINELNGIERIFYLCQTFEVEMNSDGIYHYYQSSFGNFANETVEALMEIGADFTALILDKGNSVFKNGIVPESREERMNQIEEFDYQDRSWLFDELDSEFYEYNDQLDELNLNYVLSNKEAFM